MGFGFLGLTGREDTLFGLFMAPAFGFAAYFAIRRWVSRTQGEWLGALVFAGMGVRLLAAVPRLMGGADAPVYQSTGCLLYTSPSPRDRQKSRMPSSA